MIYVFMYLLQVWAVKSETVGTTQWKDIPFISARATCTINFSVKETLMFTLKIWMLSFLEESTYTYLTQKDHFFDKEKIYFEDVNNQHKYFRGCENIFCMVFMNNMLIISLHIVFNFSLDSICDQCYLLHVKTTSLCFTFVLVIVNPIIFD